MFVYVNVDLPMHPKSIQLSRLIGEDNAWGRVVLLLMWAAKYASNGDLSRFAESDIETACEWEGEPGRLFRALVDVGFIDDDNECDDEYRMTSIHDWPGSTNAKGFGE